MIENLIALFALTAMEIVLGIDNIVFIAIITGRLPLEQQAKARRLGLGLAMGMRILLLLTLSLILKMKDPIFELSSLGVGVEWLSEHKEINEISVRDLIMLVGGLFLIAKSVTEIHERIEGEHGEEKQAATVSFASVLVQIALLDIIFSLDSVITAAGMVKSGEENPLGIWIMIVAVILAVGVMLIFAERVSAFVARHPTVKMLALSFLILIGVLLVAEGIGTAFDKGYVYFSMAFALVVEFLNLRVRIVQQASRAEQQAEEKSLQAKPLHTKPAE